MALFDIIGAVSEKQVTKTEFGDERIYGTVVGVVAENYTQEMPGRLCVTVPVRDNDANQLKWAKMVMPYMGAGWGTYFLPEKGDQVLLVFEDGSIEKPYVIGCIPKDKDKFLTESANEQNQIKTAAELRSGMMRTKMGRRTRLRLRRRRMSTMLILTTRMIKSAFTIRKRSAFWR